MIKEVKAYSLFCDNCSELFMGHSSGYSMWVDNSQGREEAEDEGWIEHECKHYCPNCYSINSDDNVVIKESDKSNE